MCTVTFVPVNGKIFITHNRDEKSTRLKAAPPSEYVINNYTLLFPKDGAAGGSWIAINKNGNAAVLLNGGFVKHISTPPYKKSRGLVFLDIIASADAYFCYQFIDLYNIEPFTLIIWNKTKLYECRWDGQQKHIKEMNATQKHTWSSATLYDATAIVKREGWFTTWCNKYPTPDIENILHFHLFDGHGDTCNAIKMNRNNILLTVSITAIEINDNESCMKYIDLQNNTTFSQDFIFSKPLLHK